MCEEPSKLLVDPKNIKRISLTEKSAFWVLKYSPGYSPVKRRHARAMPRSREEARKNVIASPWPRSAYSFDFGSGVFTIQSMNVKVFRSRKGSVIGPGFPSFCYTGETYSPCEIPRGWNINHRLVSQKPSLTSLRPRRTPWPKMCEERQGNSSLTGK